MNVKVPKYIKPVLKLPVHYDKTHYTIRRFVREQYVEEQDGLCYHCGDPLEGEPSLEVRHLEINSESFPEHSLHPIHLHHCHKTGLTIGAVHAHCNAVLWQYHGE